MDDQLDLKDIKKNFEEKGQLSKEEIQTLIQQAEFLQKKNEIITQQNAELSTEIESIRSDFGWNQR